MRISDFGEVFLLEGLALSEAEGLSGDALPNH